MAGRFGSLPGKPADLGSDLTGYKYGLPKEDGGTGERYLPRDPYKMTDGELREWGVMEDRQGPTGSELTRLQNKKAGRQLGKTAIAGTAFLGSEVEGSDDFTEDYNRRYETRQFNRGPAGQTVLKYAPKLEPSTEWVELPNRLISPLPPVEVPEPGQPTPETPETPERGMVDQILDILNPQRDRDADFRGTIEDIVRDVARPFVESPVPEAVAQGVLVDAPNGVLSLGEELNEALGAPYITWGPEGIGFAESLPEGAEPLRVPSIMDEGTQAQEVIRGFSQFFSVFGAAGGMGKGASLLKQMKAGGIADVLFDPEYGNLSTLLRELDVDNSLTQFLDSKVGEDAGPFEKLEGRAKNILEGAGLGVILPAVLAGFRAAKRADWGPAIREFLDKGTEVATGGVVKEMPLESKMVDEYRGFHESPGPEGNSTHERGYRPPGSMPNRVNIELISSKINSKGGRDFETAAIIDGERVGGIAYSTDSRGKVIIDMIGTKESIREQGVGQKLYESVVDKYGAENISRLTEVEKAKGFWEKMDKRFPKDKSYSGTVYHQTDKEFDKFDFSKSADSTGWFSESKGELTREGSAGAAASGRGRIVEAQVELKKVAGWEEIDKYSIDELRQQGYDGAILDGDVQVFDESAIKSIGGKKKKHHSKKQKRDASGKFTKGNARSRLVEMRERSQRNIKKGKQKIKALQSGYESFEDMKISSRDRKGVEEWFGVSSDNILVSEKTNISISSIDKTLEEHKRGFSGGSAEAISDQARIDKIVDEIKETGERLPIFIDHNGIIVEGRHRLVANDILGYKNIPVIYVEQKIK